MCNIQMKLKTWIQLIKSGTLENIIEDIMTNNYFQSDENAIISNKDVFKLILHLAHAANNCDKQKYKDGKDIGNLAFLLCSNLSTIPDNERFISSLYHIIRCLLRMNLYKEAENLSLHLIQDNVECTENKTNEIFRQLTYLWHESAEKELINFQEKPNHREHYDRYKNAIKYELLITKKSYKNHARHVITKLCIYLRKLIAMKNISIKYINDFIKYIIDEDYEHMSIDQNDKHKIYSSILSIIAKLICTNYNNDGDDKKFLMDILKDERNYFKNMIFDDCYQSFVHFKNTCITLLQPDEELTESISKNIEKLTNQYIDIVQRCGYTDTVTITASFFVEIFQYVFLYWENNVTLGKMQFLKSNILYETMKLIDQISKTLLKTVMENCICSNNKCTIKIDLYNHIILKAKCTILINKLSIKDLSENILQFINKFMEENIFYLKTLKESHCKHWTTLWSLCGRLLYNMGSTFESFYDTSTFFISLLCSSIIYFEGMHCEHSHLKIQNPLCVALYKLSNIHYKKCMYREAMTVSALHGLLSYTDKNSKAFKVWTSIKYKMAQTSSNFVNMSMISCLQNDRKIIEDIGIHIDLSKYDLIELCLTEAIALKDVKVNLIEAFNSLLNELHILKANIIQRTYLIQLFGYHLLHIQENYTSDIFTNTLSELELLKDKSINILCLKANLLFFIYVNELRISNECTRIEMNNAEFALKAPKLSDNQGTYVIPAYSKINIKEDLRLMELLEKSLKTWDEIEPNIIDVTQSWEPLLTLNILTIIAEYSRLYRYENCESKAWNLASKLAIELDNKDIFVYVTGRSLYLRQINKQWIDQAKEYVDNIKDYDNESKLQIIAMFWISLADFYFECGEYTTATKLLDDARSLPGITFQNNTSVYLYSLDTIIRNYNFYKKNTEQEEYTSYIIESLYSLICLKDSLTSIKCFTVPKTPEIDISKFIVQDKVSYKMCVTPVTHNQPKNPISIRRNKTPPLSKLKKVNINLSDDESDDSSSPSKLDDLCKTPISRPKLVRRKILENEYVDDNTTDKSNEKMDINKMKDISVTKIITKVAPLVPNISDHLNKITKKFDIPATNETVEQLFEMVDNLEISSPKSQRRLRSKSAPNSKESSCDNEVKDSIELFKKLVISEVETNNIVNVKQTVPTIVIDNTEATGISHKSRKTKNTLTNGNNSLEIVTLNTESEICKISKSQRRVTRSTRSTKSSTVTKTTSSVKKASSFR